MISNTDLLLAGGGAWFTYKVLKKTLFLGVVIGFAYLVYRQSQDT